MTILPCKLLDHHLHESEEWIISDHLCFVLHLHSIHVDPLEISSRMSNGYWVRLRVFATIHLVVVECSVRTTPLHDCIVMIA